MEIEGQGTTADQWIDYTPGDQALHMDGGFTADDLEAIANWLREQTISTNTTEDD